MQASKKKRKKSLLIVGLFSVVAFFTIVVAADAAVTNAAKGKLYDDTTSIPFNKVGLLLGTGKFLPDGYVNGYYAYRINATVSLMRAKKIKYLIISGDNSRKDYNEPQTMKDDLVKKGVDSNLIYLDYAGFRTFDSMIRLREIFSQTNVTIISQPFHNERALFIAEKENINAIAFNARDVDGKPGMRTQLREKLARVKVFVDYITNKKPKFLGPKVNIP
jgi:SanA protein